MSVKKIIFGESAGPHTHLFELRSKNIVLRVMEYGATIQDLLFDGRHMTLGFDTYEEYLNNTSYQGAIVGRFGNRIADGRFSLNGREYRLNCNEPGRAHLHGGTIGFDKKQWQGSVISEGENPSVAFVLHSPDGEEGYPGNLDVRVTYTVHDDAVQIDYSAESDADTVLNLTNHSYYSLGCTENILNVRLTVAASRITPTDELLIPTGDFSEVGGTPFDFTVPHLIGERIGSTHPQMLLGNGYDHNYVLDHRDGPVTHAVHAESDETGITLDCFTDRPAIQLYTANGLAEPTGRGGSPLAKHAGFCLETQVFPDSPNHPSFPSCLLQAHTPWHSSTRYCFGKTAL